MLTSEANKGKIKTTILESSAEYHIEYKGYAGRLVDRGLDYKVKLNISTDVLVDKDLDDKVKLNISTVVLVDRGLDNVVKLNISTAMSGIEEYLNVRLKKIHAYKSSKSSFSKQWNLSGSIGVVRKFWKVIIAIHKQSIMVVTISLARRQRLVMIKFELRRIKVTVKSIFNESIAKNFIQQVEECVGDAISNLDVVLVNIFGIFMDKILQGHGLPRSMFWRAFTT